MTPIQLTNTLTRQKAHFKPLDAHNVRMYVCGITPYDEFHIGNARVYVVFDVLFRLLRQVYGPDCVTYVRNFTDIDDKIIARAQELDIDAHTLTEDMIASFHTGMAALGCLAPTHEPRVTEHVKDIVQMIQTLVDKHIAYVTPAGDVNYDISRAPNRDDYIYGQLAGKNMEDMLAGARVEVDESKRHPGDFALWKAAKPHEPSWDSPWGAGRPGWHIECSAMSRKYLGDTFDIHAGGEDLQFPHHENEIAQSEGACGCKYVNYWLHNAFITVEGQKMSKSLGNFITTKQALTDFEGRAMRYWLLQTHYRKPVDYSPAALQAASTAVKKLKNAVQDYVPLGNEQIPDEVVAAVEDDLNTAKALAALNTLRKPAVAGDEAARAGLYAGGTFLGLWD